jgi:hypothetical protein
MFIKEVGSKSRAGIFSRDFQWVLGWNKGISHTHTHTHTHTQTLKCTQLDSWGQSLSKAKLTKVKQDSS